MRLRKIFERGAKVFGLTAKKAEWKIRNVWSDGKLRYIKVGHERVLVERNFVVSATEKFVNGHFVKPGQKYHSGWKLKDGRN